MNTKLTLVLDTWRSLNASLQQLKEAEVLEMLEHERQHKHRKVFLQRLHQRYTMLRAARERLAL